MPWMKPNAVEMPNRCCRYRAACFGTSGRRRRPHCLQKSATGTGSLEAAEAETCGEADRDLRLHVRELLLDELIGGEGLAEGAPRERVVSCRMPAELGGAERAPGNAVTRAIEAGERALEAADVGQQL